NGREDVCAEATALDRRLQIEGMDLKVVHRRHRGNAADEPAIDFNGRKRGGVEPRPHPGAPPRRVETADAFKVRAQDADGKVEERLKICFLDRAHEEYWCHGGETPRATIALPLSCRRRGPRTRSPPSNTAAMSEANSASRTTGGG